MQIVIFSALAGICGTGLGGLITVIFGKRTPDMMCGMLSLAAGVMTSIVCFGLVPESIDISNTLVTVSGLILGIIIIMILNRLVDTITDARPEKLEIHGTCAELYHENCILENCPIHSNRALLRSGILMLVAIGLHNLPEGIAIGAGGSHNMQFGTLLAMMIALHNIPEGMSIAAPLLGGGVKKGKVIFLTALSGAPTLIGGLLGVLFGNISDIALALSLSSAGGAMLYVVFGEIIPQAVVMTKKRTATIASLFGVILGLLIAQI